MITFIVIFLIIAVVTFLIIGFAMKWSFLKSPGTPGTSPGSKSGYNCKYSDSSKECGIECGTAVGCKKANPNCCFSVGHLDPEGKNSWCYSAKKCPSTDTRYALENYYSFAKTLFIGDVIPPPLAAKASMNAKKGSNMDDGISPLFNITFGDGTKAQMVDWDASSGLLCGNSWGKPSNLARLYFNMLSYSAPSPILNKKIYSAFLTLILNGNNYEKNIIQPPLCIGQGVSGSKCQKAQIFITNMIYNAAFMNLGLWGHMGATYGYTTVVMLMPSTEDYFPTGTWLAGVDVAIVCSQNNNVNQAFCSDAIWALLDNGKNCKDQETTKGYIHGSILYVLNQNISLLPVDTVMTMGLYAYDPKSQKSFQIWNSACIDYQKKVGKCLQRYPTSNGYLGTTIEPKYYFGSATKSLTASMVMNALYEKVWLKLPSPKSDFITWYAGTPLSSGTYGVGAITFGELRSLTSDFKNSNYFEKLTAPLQASWDDPKSVNKTLQDWLFNILYSKNACDPEWCSTLYNSASGQAVIGGKCGNCPSNICLGINHPSCNQCKQIEFAGQEIPPCCTCTAVPESKYAEIFSKISPYEISMMRAGIPDADTILSIDTTAQVDARTHAIGPIEYVSELTGFDWYPGWSKNNNGEWVPNTIGNVDASLPAARYSSSGFTLLGTLLWLLDDTQGKQKHWSEIDLNKYLPSPLQNIINFGGTSGNGGTKYMVKKGEALKF